MIKFIKALALCGLFVCSLALFYILSSVFGAIEFGLDSTPSYLTIVSLVCLLGLWIDRLYQVITRRRDTRPIPLKSRWAKDALGRLYSWTSGLVASGAVMVSALVIFSVELALPITFAGITK